MVVTVEEAKTKWCPYAIVSSFNPASPNAESGFNREFNGNFTNGTHCISTDCMF